MREEHAGYGIHWECETQISTLMKSLEISRKERAKLQAQVEELEKELDSLPREGL